MNIINGYNNKPLRLQIVASSGQIQLWLEHEDGMTASGKTETLSYMSLDELQKLKLEIDQAVKDAFNIQ